MDQFMPRIRKVIERRKNASAYWQPILNGNMSYEVNKMSDSYAVGIANKECTCNLWGLTGIPCLHAYASILYRGETMDDFVSNWYSMMSKLVIGTP